MEIHGLTVEPHRNWLRALSTPYRSKKVGDDTLNKRARCRVSS